MRTTMTISRAFLSLVVATLACQAQTEAPAPEPALERSTAALTSTLGPVADTYVRDGSDAVANFGSSTVIEVKQSTTVGLNRLSYLRFSLAIASPALPAATPTACSTTGGSTA